LANPNYGMLSHFLQQEGMEKSRTIETEWSEPSPMVSVPVDSQVLAVSAKGSDGTASLMLVRFDEKDGASAAEEFTTVQRGQLLNYSNRPFPETGLPGTAGGMGRRYAGGTAADQDDEETKRKVDYLTNALLLDVAGGGRLPGKDRNLVEPGSILLLDGDGKLVVRNELDDLPEYRFNKPPEKEEYAGMPEGVEPTRPGKRGAASTDPMAPYMQMMGGKGKASMPPGMTPGMMGTSTGPGAMGMRDLDDRGTKTPKGKKKPR
jgi:hypothetical protein